MLFRMIGARIVLVTALIAGMMLPTRADNTLRVLLPSEFASLDPVEILSGDQTMVMYHVYCRLYTFSDNMEPVPDLVASETLSPDKRTWTLRLKHGAKFQDGTSVDAEAVKYTIERMRKKGGSQKVLFQAITDIKVDNPDTIELTTEKPFPALKNSLAHPNAGLVSPKADAALGDRYGVQPVSCGPYTFKEWTRGSHITVVRNDEFYGPPARYDQIVFQFVPEESTRFLMMLRKEADMALRLGPAEARQLEAAKIKTIQIKGRNIFYQLNYAQPPTNDLKVRLALNYAVDKSAIIKNVLQGAGSPARTVLEAMTWGSIPIGTYAYDPARARALIAEANPSVRKIVLLSPDNRYLLDSQVSQAVAGYLRAVGFDVDLRVISDWAGYIDALKKRDFSMFMLGWGSSSGDPDQVLQSLFNSKRAGQPWNFGAFTNKEIDAMMDEAASTFDNARRRALYAEIQKWLFADAPWLFMYRAVNFTAVDDKVKTIHTLEGPEFHYVFDLPKR